MYLLKNAKVFDARTSYVPLDVLVDGDKIIQVAPGIPAPEGAQVIDLTGYTLLPAFVDAHIHAGIPERDKVAFRDDILTKLARLGVSLVKDDGLLTSHPLEPYMEFLTACKDPRHARVVTAGRYIDVADGYGMGPDPRQKWGIEITTAQEAADAVSYQYKAGVNGIKIGISDRGPEMTDEMIRAITDRAREHGIYTTAHVGTARALQKLVDNGIGEGAHTPADPMSDSLIAQMVAGGVSMITTVGEPRKELHDMDRRMNPGKTDEEIIAGQLERYNTMLSNLKRFYEAGGLIAIGTDLMMSDQKARIPVDELRCLTAIGMSVREAVACGTVNGVKVCGLDDQGLVQEGLLASLIAIPGELDDTFEKLDPPAFVMNQGVILRDERSK